MEADRYAGQDSWLEMDPQLYLRAGLPRPTNGPVRRAVERAIVPAGQVPDVSDYPPNTRDLPWAYTAVDEQGRPVEVTFARTCQYLFKPLYWNLNPKADVTAVGLDQTFGLLQVTFGEEGRDRRNDIAAHHPDPDNSTIVTMDLSVFLAGLRPTKFRADDALYLPMAILTETALMDKVRPDGSHTQGFGAVWTLSTPVPITQEILACYAEIAFSLPSDNPHGLTRADLLYAATAATFKTPMYTLRPEAYIGAANGLKTLKYGKTRNPDAQDHWEIPPGLDIHGEIVGWDALLKESRYPPGWPNHTEAPNP